MANAALETLNDTVSETFKTATTAFNTQSAKTIATVRKARRAYIGVHAAAFDALNVRADKAQKFSGLQFDALVERGEKLEDSVQALFSKTPKFVRRATPCGMATTVGLMPKRNEKRVVELEAELAELNKELISLNKAAKKTVKKTVKKATPKKAAAKPARHIAYWENVKAYDADANEDIVRKIVNHCGIALNSNDAKFVACSDEAERNTVRDSWLVKKLGVEATREVLDAKVLTVCETMKADRMKCRVTFYYLLAKAEGKLASL